VLPRVKSPRFSEPNAAHRLLQHTLTTHGHTLRTFRPGPPRDFTPSFFTFALPSSEVAQTDDSQPRVILLSVSPRCRSEPSPQAVLRRRNHAWAERPEQRARLAVSSPPRHFSRAPVSPTARFPGPGETHDCEGRPKTSVQRGPAKGRAFEEVEVLSTVSKSETRREGSRPPAGRTVSSFTPPIHPKMICEHCSREQRLCFSLRGASP